MSAQPTATRATGLLWQVLEETPTGVTLELRAAWPSALADAVAQAGASPEVLVLNAGRGQADVSRALDLPLRQAPTVEVVSADYEEVDLPAAQIAALGGRLTHPTAEVVAVGMERRRPVGTLRTQLLQLDEATGTVRRYRHLTLRIRYPAPLTSRALVASAVRRQATGSVLASGQWFKLPIAREGIYRIDRAYLRDLGLNPDQINPAAIQVYGNGGQPLPAVNSAPRPEDLVENAVWVQGGTGGTFSEGTAVYFYAQGPRGWRYLAPSPILPARWEHYVNPFSTQSFYFLRVDGSGGQRLTPGAFPNYPDAQPQTTYTARLFVEDDLVNLERTGGGSGLDWLGQELSATRRTLALVDTLPTAVLAGTATYEVLAAARAGFPGVDLRFGANGTTLRTVRVGGVDLGTQTGNLANTARVTLTQATAPGQRLRLDLTLAETPANATAWPNWIRVFYPRALQADRDYLRFHAPLGQAGRFAFTLTGFSAEPQVWDVTEPGAIRRLGVQASGGGYAVQVEVPDGGTPRELVAFVPSSGEVRTPARGTGVPNQNLRGLTTYPDNVILVPTAFLPAAERLAARRRQQGLETVVAPIEQVYNEFGGGMPDLRAQRDYLKFLYDRAPTADDLPRYALFFGDGHYDFRGIEPGGAANNWVPTFQTNEMLFIDGSYTSDDYFGLLDDEEGTWSYGGPAATSVERLDVGVGRLPVRSLAEADAVVNKIERYEDPATYGPWRLRYSFAADDDAPNGWDLDLHLLNADVVADRVPGWAPALNLQKVYLLSYPPEVTPVGRRIPQARADLLRSIEEGTLIWNYSGHGGPDALTDERVLTLDDIPRFTNLDRLMVGITATCSFGRFDMIDTQSGAEELVLNPQGGAVAMFTTTRVVYTSSSAESYNVGQNIALNTALFDRDPDGSPARLGDAFRVSKNTSAGLQGNNRKFSLLGDPAMRLGLPLRDVRLTRLNGTPLDGSQPPPALRALERATVEGEVTLPDGQVDTGFTGTVDLIIFDAARQVELPRSEVYTDGYNVRTDLLYQGRASVSGGTFRAEFIVPQDMSFSGLSGRISAYVQAASGVPRDGLGFSEQVVIGTSSGGGLNDQTGPQVRLFLNDSTFVDGGLVNPAPTLLVDLFDASGINTVGSGVGHELLLTIGDDVQGAVEIGRFYEGAVDDFRRGTVRYVLPEQEPGAYALRVRAWDVANNAAEASLRYVVAADEALVLRHVYNYPNPTPGPTFFLFEHNQPPGTPARIQVRLYTLAGRPIRTMDADEALPGGVLSGNLVRIPWDGRDEDGDRLASGLYLYRVRVEVERADGEREVSERIERLAIIR